MLGQHLSLLLDPKHCPSHLQKSHAEVEALLFPRISLHAGTSRIGRTGSYCASGCVGVTRLLSSAMTTLYTFPRGTRKIDYATFRRALSEVRAQCLGCEVGKQGLLTRLLKDFDLMNLGSGFSVLQRLGLRNLCVHGHTVRDLWLFASAFRWGPLASWQLPCLDLSGLRLL